MILLINYNTGYIEYIETKYLILLSIYMEVTLVSGGIFIKI
jgi:hypothetical protein